MKYIIDYDICALIVSVITMAHYFVYPKLKDRQSALYSAVGVTVAVAAALNIATVLAEGRLGEPIVASLNLLYLFCMLSLTVLLAFYALEITGRLYHMK